MTKREIALHLALLMLLVLAGGGFYAYQKSSAMVPFLIRHLDSDSLRERQAATFRLQELGNAAREFGAAAVESCARRLLSTPLTRGQIEIPASRLTVDETYFFRRKRISRRSNNTSSRSCCARERAERDEFARLNPTYGSARLTIYPTVDPHSRSYG